VIEQETETLLAQNRGRYRLATPDTALAREVLARSSVGIEERGEGVLDLDLDATQAPRAATELVRAGVRLTSFAPENATLEEIYLRLARGRPAGNVVAGEIASARVDAVAERTGSKSSGATAHTSATAQATAPSGAPATTQAPSVRRAPARPLSRVYGYETRRLAVRIGLVLLLVLPAILAASAVAWRSSQAHADARDIAGQKLFSATDVTAFEGVGLAIQAGVPLLAFLVLGIASQSISSELSGGTLRNVLLRPVLRWQVVLGKACACLSIAACGYVLLALAALASARASFEFTDVSEILPNGARFALVPASELWPALWSALAAPVLPLCAYTLLGLLAGTIVRSAAGGLALALFLGVGLDLARIVARAFGVESLLLSAYLPSPLGDTSSIRVFVETAQGISNAHFDFARTAYVVPIAWLCASLVLSILVLGRRSIP
jgi:ABC-type transport system involved in multi-copper enzyme maturation permease subunit